MMSISIALIVINYLLLSKGDASRHEDLLLRNGNVLVPPKSMLIQPKIKREAVKSQGNEKSNEGRKGRKGKRLRRKQEKPRAQPKKKIRNKKGPRKGGKSLAKEKITRQDEDTCSTFYDKDNTTAVRDFRYARSQVQKAKRAKKRIEKLDKLMGKAATAFLDGAAFYKNCSDPRAKKLYEGLSKCHVTAASMCNPSDLKNTTDYADIDGCIASLEATLASSENCLSNGKCGDGPGGACNYDPIGMVARTCDYTQFDQATAKRLNQNCSASDVEGSFTYCNNLLKDNFDVASNCSNSDSVTATSCDPNSDITLDNWTLVFSHDTSGGLFSSKADALLKNEHAPWDKLYSILDNLEDYKLEDGKFHLRIVYTNWMPGVDGFNEWYQTSNPATSSSITGFEPVHINFKIRGDEGKWGGLCRSTSPYSNTLITDTPQSDYWYMAVGAMKKWNEAIPSGGIPGPRFPDWRYAITKVELYVNYWE